MTRRFSCTACGRCCTHAPEMELTEATALADTFITRLLFKVHTLPRDAQTPWAMAWWKSSKSRLPLRNALEEAKQHLAHFAVCEGQDKPNKRLLYLTISALPVHRTDTCPALVDGRCGIYQRRPLTCRTVPFHYSRPPSTLAGYFDQFVATPGYLCDTTADAPDVLREGRVVDDGINAVRDAAMALAAQNRAWRERIAELVKSPEAARYGLPGYRDILANAAAGKATTVSMAVAWAIAKDADILAPVQCDHAWRSQIALLRAGLKQESEHRVLFQDWLADYQRLFKFSAGDSRFSTT